MDLGAYANTLDDKMAEYINRHYGSIPRCRGYRLMKLEKVSNDDGEQMKLFDSYVGKDVIYIHTRCGDCGDGYDSEYSNYISCGAKEWEEEHKDLFLEHYTDEYDSTYCDHYFKAVIDEDYRKLVDDYVQLIQKEKD